MNEFSLCIEYLLLRRDSVSVPGLGTFVAEGCSSYYDAEEETMLPPRRQVSFDASRQDDEGLVQSIAEIYSITEEEAGNKLCLWLNDFSQTLADSGYVELGSLGTFAGEEGNMSFTPSQSGVTTPDFYALDTVHIKEAERQKTPTRVIKTDSKHITISISKRVVSYAAAACVAVVLFLWLSSPTGYSNAKQEERASASSLFLPTGFTLTPSAPEVKTSTEMEPQPAEEMTEDGADKAQEVQEIPEEPRYCIVMASAVSRKNAEAFVNILQQRGLDAPRLMEGKILRVVVGAYDNADEAYRAARELHRLSEEYSYAWVYERK